MSGKTRHKRPPKPAACGSKIKYTEHGAKDFARYLWEGECIRMRAYRCLWCHLPDGRRAWHVGH